MSSPTLKTFPRKISCALSWVLRWTGSEVGQAPQGLLQSLRLLLRCQTIVKVDHHHQHHDRQGWEGLNDQNLKTLWLSDQPLVLVLVRTGSDCNQVLKVLFWHLKVVSGHCCVFLLVAAQFSKPKSSPFSVEVDATRDNDDVEFICWVSFASYYLIGWKWKLKAGEIFFMSIFICVGMLVSLFLGLSSLLRGWGRGVRVSWLCSVSSQPGEEVRPESLRTPDREWRASSILHHSWSSSQQSVSDWERFQC